MTNLEIIRNRFRNLTFKSMNGWLTEKEQAFYSEVTKKLYGGCNCPEAHIPSERVMQTIVRKHGLA